MAIGWWEVLTDAVIPGLGVAASTAVAVAALVVSSRAVRIAQSAHREELSRDDIDDRREFAAAALRYLDRQSVALVTSSAVERATDLTIHAASIENSGAVEIVEWIRGAMMRFAEITDDKTDLARSKRNNAFRALRKDLESRFAEWVASGDFDFERFKDEASGIT